MDITKFIQLLIDSVEDEIKSNVHYVTWKDEDTVNGVDPLWELTENIMDDDWIISYSILEDILASHLKVDYDIIDSIKLNQLMSQALIENPDEIIISNAISTEIGTFIGNPKNEHNIAIVFIKDDHINDYIKALSKLIVSRLIQKL